MSETETLYIEDIVSLDSDAMQKQERDTIVIPLQKHIVSSIKDAYESVSPKEGCSIVCDYEEKCLELVLCMKKREYYMVGLRGKNYLEYISCSEDPMDLNYTIKNSNENERGTIYTYREHPSIVFKNSIRILSVFHEFITPEVSV